MVTPKYYASFRAGQTRRTGYDKWETKRIPNRILLSFHAQSATLERRVLQRLRVVGAIEGTSTLMLFFVAMPLKYLADKPMAVSIVGAIHGVLFLLYCGVLAYTAKLHKRPVKWVMKFFVASLLPFGPFVVDKTLKQEISQLPDEE